MAFPGEPLFAPPWTDRGELRAFQDAQLRRIVRHAYERVPYYRELFDAHGVKPGDVRGVQDLGSIPVTDRGEMQRRPAEEMVTTGVDEADLTVTRTSGSSGRPVTIRRDATEAATLRSIRLRRATLLGLRPMEMHAVLAGRVHDEGEKSSLARLYPTVRLNWVDPPETLMEELRACRPRVISGFPGVLTKVAALVTEEDRRAFDLRMVMTGGEVLTAAMRRLIAESFGARVFDTYGSHEFGALGWECRETGAIHVSDDGVVLEVIAADRTVDVGERGEVVATALHSFTQPFIRYRLGDLVTRGPETCSCGSSFSLIGSIQGRMIDHFVLPDGRLLHPYRIVSVVLDRPWVREYRLVQEREDRVVAEVVAQGDVGDDETGSLCPEIEAVLGPGVEVVVRRVASLELERTGKFRVSCSLVRSHYDRTP